MYIEGKGGVSRLADWIGTDRIPRLSNDAKAILTCRTVPSGHTIANEMSCNATKPIRLDSVSYFNFFALWF